mmetsp:Transcript_52519/g.152971  ORF Transcript_52519/g.152971 Transcript_52519/m.152971 type:complete len:200 (+) Transcript_52519:920-1519(+)
MDVHLCALAEETREQAGCDVGERRIVGHTLGQRARGVTAQEDLAQGDANIGAKTRRVSVLVGQDGIGKLLHDVGPIKQDVASDVVQVFHVLACLHEGLLSIRLQALADEVFRLLNNLLDVVAELHGHRDCPHGAGVAVHHHGAGRGARLPRCRLIARQHLQAAAVGVKVVEIRLGFLSVRSVRRRSLRRVRRGARVAAG